MNHIRWDNQPPRDALVPVLSVKAGKPLTVIAAGPCRGVWTHWDGSASRPCPGRDHGCERCVHQSARWKGYLPCMRLTGSRCIVEVTIGAVRALPLLLCPEVSGRVLRIERRIGRSNAALFVVPVEGQSCREGIVDYDPRPTLLRMWEMPED